MTKLESLVLSYRTLSEQTAALQSSFSALCQELDTHPTKEGRAKMNTLYSKIRSNNQRLSSLQRQIASEQVKLQQREMRRAASAQRRYYGR